VQRDKVQRALVDLKGIADEAGEKSHPKNLTESTRIDSNSARVLNGLILWPNHGLLPLSSRNEEPQLERMIYEPYARMKPLKLMRAPFPEEAAAVLCQK
jgi:hypothetical protein